MSTGCLAGVEVCKGVAHSECARLSEKDFKNCRLLANDRYICINFKGDCLCGTLGYLFLVMIVFSSLSSYFSNSILLECFLLSR